MSGITPESVEGQRGWGAGKIWKEEYIRRARLYHLELSKPKLVHALAPIAFLLIFVAPSLVFSQVAARTLSGKVTSESGSGIPNTHLSVLNTDNEIGRASCREREKIAEVDVEYTTTYREI